MAAALPGQPAQLVGYWATPPPQQRAAGEQAACVHRHPHRPQHHHRRLGRRRRGRRGAGIALSTILDLEDSVAAVDAEDKVLAQQLAGILRGADRNFQQGGKALTRGLNARPRVHRRQRSGRSRPARPQPAVCAQRRPPDDQPGHPVGAEGQEIPEGIMDAVITTTIAMPRPQGPGPIRPEQLAAGLGVHRQAKMHGPAEVAFACELFSRVEQLLGLPEATVSWASWTKSAAPRSTCKACIAAAVEPRGLHQHRLPRSHRRRNAHAMLAGPMMRKGDIKTSAWIAAYERRNADRPAMRPARPRPDRQGQWAMPDLMAEMLEQKIGHPKAGANTAWTPAPPPPRCTPCTTIRVLVADVQKPSKPAATPTTPTSPPSCWPTC